MIEDVRNALVVLGLSSENASLTYNAFVRRDFIFDAFVNSQTFYRVKLSRERIIESEYRAMVAADIVFPGMLPAPLGLVQCGPWRALVCSGVSHRRFSLHAMARQPQSVEQFFAKYFERADQALRLPTVGIGHAARIAGYATLIDNARTADDLIRTMSGTAGEVLDKLPRIRQHGDLYPGNIGFTHDSIVIFDWEDFGVSDLPGLDICVLVSAALDFRPDLVDLLLKTGKPDILGRLVKIFCEIYRLDSRDFAAIAPLLLLEFLYLKKTLSYGEGIQKHLQLLVRGICDRSHAVVKE